MSQAFNSGRRATEAQLAPEFLDVEEALNRLVKTLKSLAECFAVEGVESFLEGIESDARDGISTILMACRRTLEGLEELVSSLQTIKKTSSAHGYTIERIWKDDVLQRQDALPWMANGRSLQDLFDTLNMHSVVTAMLISITKRYDVFFDLFIGLIVNNIQSLNPWVGSRRCSYCRKDPGT
jgi:hypothetical protein